MHTYGPVPSRRLGRSIGVSPIPSKTCSYSCVYCQLGSTTNFTIQRDSFFDREDILQELINRVKDSDADFITYVGDGEPTLCSDLGWLIGRTQQYTDLPIAVITNGSLLYNKSVQNELQNADIVMPSIDAGDEKTFQNINRAHKNLEFTEIVQGIIEFNKIFQGELWTETMLVQGYNDSEEQLNKINGIIDKIKPKKSFTMIPSRPPVEDVHPPKPDNLLYAQKTISNTEAIDNIEEGNFNINNYNNLAEALNEISKRHPLRKNQAHFIAKQFKQENNLEELISEGKFVIKKYTKHEYILPSKL